VEEDRTPGAERRINIEVASLTCEDSDMIAASRLAGPPEDVAARGTESVPLHVEQPCFGGLEEQ
jgi:hypothetical protein